MAAMGKHLVNTPSQCVDDSLEGLVSVNPGLQLLDGHRVVIRADIDDLKARHQVTLVSGGGSGHEPAHGGYVGPGMLSAAVCGDIFTSPPPGSILAALRAVGKGNTAGTLLIVKNYTGDRLNFGLAAERAKAEGLRVDMVVVGEDCALTSTDKTAGRRGLCGTILIHKLAGSLAESGRPLDEILSVCQSATANMGTIGLSLSPCNIPGRSPSFILADDEVELGLGIHGEAGVRRIKILPADQAVAAMLGHMTDENSSTQLKLHKDVPVTLMVNNLGGTSILELHIVAKEAIEWLENHGIVVERVYCGSFMTSLDMAGVSLTILNMSDIHREALSAPTSAPGWCCPLWENGSTTRITPLKRMDETTSISMDTNVSPGKQVNQNTGKMIHGALVGCAEALINCEVQLNELDRESGDGDCGTTLKRGAQDILAALGSADSPGLPTTCPQRLLLALANIIESSMGGSSGALYSLMLTAASVPLACDTSPQAWCDALGAGIQTIMRYGGAEPGDRTMLDALHAGHKTLSKSISYMGPLQAFEATVKAAEEAAEKTTYMIARAGRASYVSRDHLTVPDPGAQAIAVWMRAACERCKIAYK